MNTSAMLKSRYVPAGEFSEEEYIGQSIHRTAESSAVQYGVSTLVTAVPTRLYLVLLYCCTSRLKGRAI